MNIHTLYARIVANKVDVETIGDQIIFFNERRSPDICRELSYHAITIVIGNEVRWYLMTGLLPYEEYCEERPWTDEVEWQVLTKGIRYEVESWERQGKEFAFRRLYLV